MFESPLTQKADDGFGSFPLHIRVLHKTHLEVWLQSGPQESLRMGG
jgi:hypothetical protein